MHNGRAGRRPGMAGLSFEGKWAERAEVSYGSLAGESLPRRKQVKHEVAKLSVKISKISIT